MTKKKFIFWLVIIVLLCLVTTIAIILHLAYKTAIQAEINFQGLSYIERSLESYLSTHNNEWPKDWSFLDPDEYNPTWNKNFISEKFELKGVNLPDNSNQIIIHPKPIYAYDDIIENIEKMYNESIKPPDR